MKLDRLLGILTILLQRDRITASELANKFEVNRRTIGRDINTLCQAGIPIVTYQGTGGGISIMEGFKLDKNILTTGELSNIVAALKGIGSISDKTQIERVLDKFGASSDAVISINEPIIIDLASHYKGTLTAKIEAIKQAIINSKVISFDYYYEKGECRRKIEPYMVIFQWSSWYVFGYCQECLDWRMFKLNRLWNLSIEDVLFTVREIPPVKCDFTNFIPDDKKLVAIFDKSVKYILIDYYGPDCYQETESGLLFEIGYTNQSFIISWLLGFGDKVKIIEPESIVNEIQQNAINILNAYK